MASSQHKLSVFDAYKRHKPTQHLSVDESTVQYCGKHGANKYIHGSLSILVTNFR